MCEKFRIIKKGPFYVIEEIVTPQGYYIELPGVYALESNAQKKIDRLKGIK